jgi:bla regulator protein blaR1
MRRLLVALWLAADICAIGGQAPTFEVATIRQNRSGDRGGGIRRQPGGRLTVTNMSLRTLITFAYQITGYQLVGGPGWADSDAFDVLAKMEGNPEWGAPGSGLPDPAQLAMQSLLAERFKLKLHHETRDLDVYALVMVSPGTPGPALKPSSNDCKALAEERRQGKLPQPAGPPPATGIVPCSILGNAGMIRFDGFGMPQVANILIGQAGRLVVDRTNLAGSWQFVMTFAPEQRAGVAPDGQPAPSSPDAPSFFTALREQLGLKLESTKAPVDVTVIDTAVRPTDD